MRRFANIAILAQTCAPAVSECGGRGAGRAGPHIPGRTTIGRWLCRHKPKPVTVVGVCNSLVPPGLIARCAACRKARGDFDTVRAFPHFRSGDCLEPHPRPVTEVLRSVIDPIRAGSGVDASGPQCAGRRRRRVARGRAGLPGQEPDGTDPADGASLRCGKFPAGQCQRGGDDEDRRPHRAAGQAAAGRQERDRGGLGQGRSGQVDRPSTWHWRWQPRARAWACWMPTSTGPACRCWASMAVRNRPTARPWSRWRATACRRTRSVS